MGVSITVLYPKTEDSKFDMGYYETTHMPLVARLFKPYGFNGYRVLSFTGTANPAVPTPYSVQCSLEFDTEAGFHDALKANAGEVLGDVPNFSNKDPMLIVGDVVTSV